MAQPEKEEYYSSACNVSTPDMGTTCQQRPDMADRVRINGVTGQITFTHV